MSKRLIDVDDEVLEQARALLEGATIKDTVNTALQEFCNRDTMLRLLSHLQQLGAEDLGDEDIMDGVHRHWPPR